MNKAIYRYELRQRWSSVGIWIGSLAGIVLIFMSLFSSFSADMAVMNQMLEKFPPEFKAVFGLTALDLATLEGYYAFCFIFCQLCLAIQAANYGLSLVSVEEAELTADFLLTRPLSRPTILTSKLLAALTSLLVTQIFFWAASLASITLFKGNAQYELNAIFLLFGSTVIFQLIFFSVGLLISLLVSRMRSITPWSLGLALGTYVISAFSGILGDAKLEYLSPFKHFEPGKIIRNLQYDTRLVLLDVALVILAVGVSYWLYQNRDIASPS
jgi:ABC-2 type transport system permease protein